ncbi:MAG: hypothetical protein J5U19_11020 [Candidatus Methanoperedens sp.]|nr:hypothetical protein [Candidatus Methanoperedens sp.]MCE8428908.1 hypothetical protein [Candidatus Methanoperedens sp.]
MSEMEICKICKGEQDSKQYKDHNICTGCTDLMEDVMSGYFVRTVKFEKKRNGFMRYVEGGQNFQSDYQRIRKHSKRHIQHLQEHALEKMKEGAEGGKLRYLDRLLLTINWLERSPEFYNSYFKDFSTCPHCRSSIFENYEKQEIGDWLIIKCAKCDMVIKKYFSPKFIS